MTQKIPWTHFHDMHSGGSQKLSHGHIFIQAPHPEAEIIFQNRFGRNPNRVTCTCCGPDYSVSEHKDLTRATAYERGCAYDEAARRYVEREDTKWGIHKYIPLEGYIASGKALIIKHENIHPTEREGSLRPEGYVWAGEDGDSE